ncbi:VWA domain-containing protein [Nocardioidaceae bacterium]|nr:VWA domain-containing protein [Nocardioidaceae bacterium]
MSLLDQHLAFLDGLREAGLPVSLAEGLDAVHAVEAVGVASRTDLRRAYAATLVKRAAHQAAFDVLFDLYFPPAIGEGVLGDGDLAAEDDAEGERRPPTDAEALADLRERLAALLLPAGSGEGGGEGGGVGGGHADAGHLDRRSAMEALAREAVSRFGRLGARPDQGQQFSAYAALRRVDPGTVVPDGGAEVAAGVSAFTEAVEADARRRQAEQRGPAYVADYSTRPPIEQLAFTHMKRADLDEVRREIYPLSRRLASRLTRAHSDRRRGPVDVRSTMRHAMSTGGVPVDLRHRPKRPGRTDLVVLCDVSSSVANFASFTLLLVFALREQFNRVRAFTFVDQVTEVTDWFSPGDDVAETMTVLRESAAHASRFGRTNYGRAFRSFAAQFPDALDPRTSLLVLGDARSNHADLHLDVLRGMVEDARHAYWLNPEARRQWGTGDSAAWELGTVVPMRECRNLEQLGEFVHDLA